MRGKELFACRCVVNSYGQVGEVSDLQSRCVIDGPVFEMRARDGEQSTVVTTLCMLN